jgi:hypothetical protein
MSKAFNEHTAREEFIQSSGGKETLEGRRHR